MIMNFKAYVASISTGLTFLLGMQQTAFGQAFEGLVSYTEQMVFKPDSAQMADPRFQQMQSFMQNPPQFKKHLRLGATASLYITDPADLAAPADPDDPQARMRMMMRQESEVYRDLATGELLEYTDFMGKKFLVNGDEARKWKMSTEVKSILGYPCMKAVSVDSMGSVEAWFTMSIPVSTGPRGIGGLPGLVLEASLRNGKFLITADKFDQRPLTEAEPISKPDKGKPVSREEYKIIVKEKMAEMKANGGGGPWMRH